MKPIRTFLQTGAAAAALATMMSAAQAGGFAIREQSAEGLGSDFAGMAAGSDGLSAMFWNPATIAQHNGEGLVVEGNGTLIAPYSRATNGTGYLGSSNSGNIGVDAFVPSGYATYGVNDRLTVGLAVTAPFGLATDSDPWMGSLHGDQSNVMTVNVSPSVAYKLSDWLAIGAGIEGEYAQMKLTSSLPTGAEIFRAKTHDTAIGFNAGLLLTPSDNLDIGLGFRSSVHHDTDGSGTYLLAAYSGPMGVSIDTPETVSLGIRYRPDDRWTLKLGGEWANWSRFAVLQVTTPGVNFIPPVQEHWNDSWMVSAGADYAVTSRLTLRGGLGYEKSPVPDAYRTPRLPDNDRFTVALGASYKVTDNFVATLGYAHLFVKDGNVNLTSPTPLVADFKQHVDIVSAGATVKW